MADYSDDQLSAYNDIAEAGGKIWFIGDGKPAPKDPDLPWEGSDDELANEVEHVAVFFPLSENVQTMDANPFAESCLIPSYGINFEVRIGTIFRREDGVIQVVNNVIALKPNGTQAILYTCEVNTWPGT